MNCHCIKGHPSKRSVAKTDFLDPPCWTSSVWQTPPPHLGRPDVRIERKNVRNAKYIAIRTKIYCDPDQNLLRSTGGGVGLQYGNVKKNYLVKIFFFLAKFVFFSGCPADGRLLPVRGRPLWPTPPRPLPSGRLLMDDPFDGWPFWWMTRTSKLNDPNNIKG